MNKMRKWGKSGSAMIMTLLIMVILLAMGTAMLGLGMRARVQAAQSSSEIVARTAADAGLTKALFEMNEKLEAESWSEGSLPIAENISLPYSDGDFSYQVGGNLASGYVIKAIGRSGDATKMVTCGLLVESSLFQHAVFSDGDMTIKNGARIDGYNSAVGLYGGSNVSTTSIGTNSTSTNAVVIGNEAEILGDVAVGPGGDPSKVITYQTADITGDTYANMVEKELDTIVAPSLSYIGTAPGGTIISTSGQYDEISLINNEIVTIQGDVVLHITGDVKLDTSASIDIPTGSSLTLYVNGEFEISNNATLNNIAKDPAALRIFSTATSEVVYTFNNNSDFYGALYAPLATVNLTNNGSIYGSVVGEEVNINNNGEVHYDEALRIATVDDVGVSFVVSSWQDL